jgi:hypothetical protein
MVYKQNFCWIYKVKSHFDIFHTFGSILKKSPHVNCLFIFSGSNMKTFAAVSVESTITHVTSHSNNTLNNVVTTIAAQVNPPYTTADVLTTSASVNDDVFKSSNLDEEDLQVKLCSHSAQSAHGYG